MRAKMLIAVSIAVILLILAGSIRHCALYFNSPHYSNGEIVMNEAEPVVSNADGVIVTEYVNGESMNYFIVSPSIFTSDREHWTKTKTVAEYSNRYVGIHPDFKRIGCETKADALFLPSENLERFDAYIDDEYVSLNVNSFSKKGGGSEIYTIEADSDRWSKCGVWLDATLDEYLVEVKNSKGELTGTRTEQKLNKIRSYEKAVYIW